MFVLLVSVSSVSAAIHADTISGTAMILGGQYFNFSSGQNGTSGDVRWINVSGVNVVMGGGMSMTSTSKGYFNSSPAYIEGMGPNMDINKTYKVPASTDVNPFGGVYYSMFNFPLFQANDGVAVKTNNNTYAAFSVTSINISGGVAVSINISYRYNSNGSNVFADKPTTGCAQSLTEGACYDSAKTGASCYWDNWMGLCNEAGGSSGGGGASTGGGGSSGGNFADCIKFDKNAAACGNISVCQYNSAQGWCDPTPDFSYSVGLNCTNFLNNTLCNNQPHTAPLCTWNATGAVCLANNTKTNSNLPTPPYSTCDAAPTQITCSNLTNLSYMPCEWESSKNKCKMNFDGIFGGGGGSGFGNIFEVTTKSSCEAMGGTWKTDTYSFTNSYGQTQTATDSWCEMSFGDYSKENCADSCWACEQQDNGSAWATVDAAKAACINSSVGYCEFYQDSNALNGKGWCEPSSKVSFGYVDCSTICSGCFTNSSCAKSAATCAWTADPFSFDLDGNGSFDNSTDGFCDPQSVAAWKNCDQNCFACNAQSSCEASLANHSVAGGCTWNSQQYYCKNTTGPGQELEICFIPGDENNNGLFDCADPACGNDPACGAGSGSGSGLGAGMGGIDPQICMQHDNNQAGCQGQLGAGPLGATPVCYYHPAPGQDALFPAVGWCDPIFNKESAGGMIMDKPPVMLGQDAAADVSYPWLDIVGFGIHDSPQTIDIGIATANMTNNTACYKSFNSQPGRENATGKYFRYIDVDGNTTNSCKADNDISVTGFEYKFIHQYSNGSSPIIVNSVGSVPYNSTFDSTLAYKCVSSNWVPFSAQLTFMQDGCNFGAGGGPGGGGGDSMGGVDILLIKKADIGSPKVPIRIYVATHNGTNVSVDSAGPSYYTPGSVDAKFEDCSATGQDFDGDGLDAQNDPDCQKFIKLGYIPFEGGPQCKDGKDNDGNGLTDCSDYSCKYDPYSGCGFALACDTADKSAPQIKWQSVEKLLDSAQVSFDSNEPANGTLDFYHNDTKCSTLNATIKDAGLLDGFTDNDFKPWHDADIGQNTLGYALASNTTYYYKFKMSDLCGNTLVSNCNNFTTSTSDKTFIFKPMLDGNITMSIPNLSIINNTFAYGKKLNQSQTKNIEIRINDTANDYGLTFLNCSITKAFDVNFSGALVYNSTTKAAGMNTAKWNEVSQNLGCKTIKVKLPATGNELWHCDDNNQSNCYQVDNSSQTAEDAVTCTYSTSDSECKIAVSQGLGFSVYEPRTTPSSGGSPSGTSSGGGGGGGGGGGVAVSSNFEAKATRAWDVIAANDLKVFAVKNEKISVSSLSFSVSKESVNAEVEVGVLKALPSTVKEGSLTVYQNLQVTHKNIENADVNSATIEFSVANDWLANKSIAAKDISLYRYDESLEVWKALSTKLLSSDAEKAYYSASSPGLSYFAIAAKEKIVAPAAKEEVPEATAPGPLPGEVTTAAVSVPEKKKGLPSWWIYAALTVVVVIAAVIIKKRRLSKKQ